MKFLHIADIHLGCRRYNLEERAQDFYRAWDDVIVRHAIPSGVDFVLIAGDFFDKRNIDPQAMNHAIAGLDRFRIAGIPVIAIEGNHDQHGALSDFSWMRSLSLWGYLNLLEPVFDQDGVLCLKPWDEERRSGSYIDIAGARIFGSHWYGASANAAVPILAEAIRKVSVPGRFNILMLHTDVEGQLNRPIPALSIAKLKELRDLTQYVALGHTHKRFEIDNWAFNPGSLEPTSIDEYREERGAYVIDVDEDFQITASHVREYVQRPFQRLSYDVSGAEDAQEVFDGVIEVVEREGRPFDSSDSGGAPIIEITLRGHLGFKNSLLQINRMRDEARRRTAALHVMIRNQSVPVEYGIAVGMDIQAPRHERERRIVEDLVARDNRFRNNAAGIADMIIESKRLALVSETPENIAQFIETRLTEISDEVKALGSIAAQSALEQNAR